jgi:hypothetical protein
VETSAMLKVAFGEQMVWKTGVIEWFSIPNCGSIFEDCEQHLLRSKA